MTATAPYPNVFRGYEANRPRHKRWVKQHLIDEFQLEPGTLLDAGCGEGFWGDLFADYGFDVSGFDIEREYVAAGMEKYPRVKLYRSDAEETLPFWHLNGTALITERVVFDVVFVRQISHLYQHTLDGAGRVLRNLLPHGRMMLLVAYTDGTGEDREGQYGGVFRHHTVPAYERMIRAAGGNAFKLHVTGRYHVWGIRQGGAAGDE